MPIKKDFLTLFEKELKKEICKTVGELYKFINYVEAKYGFIP